VGAAIAGAASVHGIGANDKARKEGLSLLGK